MSYYESFAGALTELEINCGVEGLLNGGSQCWCGEYECNEHGSWSDELKLRAIKYVAGLSSNREIKLALIKKIHIDSLSYAVARYMKKEELPSYYSNILYSNECIDILIKGILHKVCNIPPSDSLAGDIFRLKTRVILNEDNEIAYDRVRRIQIFIHSMVDWCSGEDSHKLIPVKPMKNALSAARLHLNISDIENSSASNLNYINKKSLDSANYEYDYPKRYVSIGRQREIPRWRVRHMRSLFYFFPKGNRNAIESIGEVPENLDRDVFITTVAELYANLFR